MKVTESILSVSELVISSEQEAERTPGCHVSAIINSILTNLGDRDNEFTREDLDKFAIIGRVFETVLSRSLFPSPRYERIGEITVDGIIGSPDCFDLHTGAVGEFKCTFKSVKQGLLREWLWQVKSYCHMLEVDRAFVVALYIAGVWRPPVPVLKRFDLEFTSAELSENWLMMKREKAALWERL